MNITGSTRLFGVIGDPVTQIATPNVINPIFEEHGSDIICFPLHVSPQALPMAWAGYKRTGNLAGLGVTIPHKRAVARLCDRLEGAARELGVVNCVRREADGTMVGTLFDGEGFVEGLRHEGHGLKNRSVLILGAGAAGTAVAFALADSGVTSVAIANRTLSAAKHLVESLRESHPEIDFNVDHADAVGYNVVINCTSLGLNEDDPLPIDTERLSADMVIAEVIPTPKWTKLLTQAQKIGCQVHTGEHMIAHQVRLTMQFITNS